MMALGSNVRRDLPSQDPPREVVDHRVQIGSASVEQPDQRRIDVPDLIGMRSPYPDFRFGRMDPLPRPSPLMITDQPIPSARRSKDLAEALSEQGQRPDWDMSVLVRCRQFMDRFDFRCRELLRANSWTRWPVIEYTLTLAFPMVITRRRQPDDS